ncbi:ROK family protein [Microbacterium sp. TWP3-1-2b2]|uniref:ROK family protein n=1 Tax=Microbacterium sp. TWP3-1-2b2 TaxID=2804651 RepID=UPI003CEF67AB
MVTLAPNAQRLLHALFTDGPAYRADLARTLDVTRATITNLVNSLRADGWIEETDPEPGSLKNLLGTTSQLGVLASVMFLVDTCTVALATLDGRELKQRTLDCSTTATPLERLTLGTDLTAGLLTEVDLTASDLRAVHLAVDTQMDAQTGAVYAQNASSRWFGVNPKQHFSERFEVPVHAQNTARLEGLAENLWGAGRGHDDMLHIEISYGITSGHVIDRVLQSGARGGSGELGHAIYDWNGPECTCGNSGCLMQYASIPALLREHDAATEQAIDWAGFRRLVLDGDATATSIAHRAAGVLGRMLVNTCHIVDPGLLVLGGEVARELPSFVDEVAAVIRRSALPLVGRNLSIVPAQLDDTLAATARAGIESLRAMDALILAATESADRAG